MAKLSIKTDVPKCFEITVVMLMYGMWKLELREFQTHERGHKMFIYSYQNNRGVKVPSDNTLLFTISKISSTNNFFWLTWLFRGCLLKM